jgi:hypothetical protein
MFCKIKDCKYADFHISAGHLCKKCLEYGHDKDDCDNLENCNYSSLSDIIPQHMQCQIPTCLNRKQHTSEGHYCARCDHWGSFCQCVFQVIKCPLCRITNTVSNIDNIKIYGLSQNCSVCMERNIKLCLPLCKHACLCEECFYKISEEQKAVKHNEEDMDVLDEAIKKLGDRNNVYVVMFTKDFESAWYVKRVNEIVVGFYITNYEDGIDDSDRLEAFLKNCININ